MLTASLAANLLTVRLVLWRAGDDLVDPQLSTYLVDFLVTAELSGFELPVDSVATAYAWSYRLTEESDLGSELKSFMCGQSW